MKSESKYRVSVVGLGKVGLPLAVQFATHGAHVIGCDLNPAVVAAVNQGQTPIRDETNLGDWLAKVHAEGYLEATTDTTSAVSKSNVVVIIVPLLVDQDRHVDFRFIDSAVEAVGRGLKQGTLVSIETTLPVGTTRSRIASQLEAISGMKAGSEFFVAFSPERIRTGRIFRDLASYPKVVGGLGPRDTELASDFYGAMLDADILAVSSAESAELSKLLETTYRDINIAVANEFAVFAANRGLDVFEAIHAANSQPQSQIHVPGIGVGGHCIPVYPYFMIGNAEEDEIRLARVARQINDEMPFRVLEDIAPNLHQISDKRAIVIGLSYRANVKESAFSVAFSVVTALERLGFAVAIHDAHYTDEEVRALGLTPAAEAAIDDFPVVVVQALHHELEYRRTFGFPNARIVVDGRRDLIAVDGMKANGQRFVQVGMPS